MLDSRDIIGAWDCLSGDKGRPHDYYMVLKSGGEVEGKYDNIKNLTDYVRSNPHGFVFDIEQSVSEEIVAEMLNRKRRKEAYLKRQQ